MSSAIAGVIEDLCHHLALAPERLKKIEIWPRHIEVWTTDGKFFYYEWSS